LASENTIENMTKICKKNGLTRQKAFFYVALGVAFFSLTTAAQTDFHYNFDTGSKKGGSGYSGVQAAFNANLLLPFSTLSNLISAGIGANINLKYMFDSKFAIGAYGGYNLLAGRPAVIGQTNSIIQFGATAEYYLLKGTSSPYLGLDVGNYIFSQNTSANASGANQSFSYSRNSLGIGPNIGFVYNLNPNMLINANLKYNHTFEPLPNSYNVPTQFLQVTIGLIFNLSYTPTPPDDE